MTITQDFNNELHNLGINASQAALMGSGVFLGLILPLIIGAKKKSQGMFHLLGIGTFMAGAAWFLADKTGLVTTKSKYTSAVIPYHYNPQMLQTYARAQQMYRHAMHPYVPNTSLPTLPRFI